MMRLELFPKREFPPFSLPPHPSTKRVRRVFKNTKKKGRGQLIKEILIEYLNRRGKYNRARGGGNEGKRLPIEEVPFFWVGGGRHK